jgi:hypothetical protein
MGNSAFAAGLLCLGVSVAQAQGVVVGQKLPDVEIADRGVLVPTTRVQDGRMVLAGPEIGHRPWHPRDLAGRVWTLYHLAARVGVDDINKAYIDALVAAHLPETAPDGAYKTVTVLNLDDAFMGLAGVGRGRLEKSQREVPYAIHVDDAHGAGRRAWGLQPGQSAVLVVDRDGTVLFRKEGRLSPEEIRAAVAIIRARL